MKLGERTLLDRVRNRVGYPLWKHRDEDTTNDEIEQRIDQTINNWTMLELLDAISFEIEDAESEE